MGKVNRSVLKEKIKENKNAASAAEPDKAITGTTEKWRNLPLRKFFILTVLFTFSAVALLSGLIIWGCAAFRHYLLPDSDSVYLTLVKSYADGTEAAESHLLPYGGSPVMLPEIMIQSDDGTPGKDEPSIVKYSIEKLENSYDRLTPKRQLAYTGCGILMVAGPVTLSLGGILFCSFYFYRRKLLLPLKLLSEATKQISAQNLDFTLNYEFEDEMGDLCRSFSRMQSALQENNKILWSALEERKKLQASVAHDLRNPIAIIQGYTEYLENKALSGNLTPEKTLRIAENLNMAAKRLERYTESIRTLNQLEDMEVNRETVSVSRLAADLAADFGLAAVQNGKTLYLSCYGSAPRALTGESVLSAPPESGLPFLSGLSLPAGSIFVDTVLLYRILENIIGNSLRFSEKKIFLDFMLEPPGECTSEPRILSLTVEDDGKGFPSEMLQKQASKPSQYKIFSGSADGSHMGIGIAISNLLCQKHGGTLSLSNSPSGGARVNIILKV